VKYRFGDSQWYATAAKGYRYGGRNAPPTNDEYKSDSLWSYETGVRLNPGAGVQLDLSAFMLDWTDAQFTFFERLNGNLPNSRIGNVGKARSTGLEASLRWRVNAAFDVAASLASIDAKTRAAVTIPSGGPTSITVAPGAKLPGTPDLQASLQANLRFAGPETMDTRIFGRLTAWQNWIFQRPNAVGEKGALKVYGTGSKSAFDWNRV
jgi:outer membrane receptor protein involved in Fe transport